MKGRLGKDSPLNNPYPMKNLTTGDTVNYFPVAMFISTVRF